MGVLNEIAQGLAGRLESITSANGYQTNVKNVFYDDIPMGLELEPHQLPAILLLAGENLLTRKNFNCSDGKWSFFLQLIHGDVKDEAMFAFVGDIARAVYADSPVEHRFNKYRTIHPALTDCEMPRVEPDINMIEANRFAIVELVLSYKTALTNL